MLALLLRIYHLVRVVGTAFAVAGTLARMLGGSMTGLLPLSVRPIALDLWHAITSWPVYAVSLLLAGAWLQDWFDARLLALEGRPSWFGIRALRARLLFTSWIVGRPGLYSDELKIRRELERADAALVRAGFAPLRGLPLGKGDDVAPTRDYIASVRALISAIGAERAADASAAVKECLAPGSGSPRGEQFGVADGSSPARRGGRSIADLLPWFSRRRR